MGGRGDLKEIISEIVYKKKTLIDFGYLNGNKCFNLPDVCE
jgi:hypothetical protein